MTGRSRKSARTQAGPKGAGPIPRPTFRLIALAVAILAACVYAFYYLDHLPQAEIVRSGESWKVDPGEQLRLHGMTGGTALSFNLREPGALKLSFDRGTIRQGHPTGTARGYEFSLFNILDENLTGTIALSPASPEARSTLRIAPSRPDPRFLELAVSSPDAPLTVSFGVVLDSSLAEHGRIVAAGERDALHSIRLVVPPGAAFRIGVPREQLDGLIVESGTIAGFEIGSGSEEDFERRAMVCGADRGRLLWQRIVPDVGASDCVPGRIEIERISLGDGVELAVAGAGFTVRDGTTSAWRGFRDFRQNDVVKALISALLVALIGWVILVVRRRVSG